MLPAAGVAVGAGIVYDGLALATVAGSLAVSPYVSPVIDTPVVRPLSLRGQPELISRPAPGCDRLAHGRAVHRAFEG